jgi:dethiobiotin synthetase
MNRGWFVTATDTGAGKTLISTLLLRTLAQQGLRVAGMKPVASGCRVTADGLRSEDAEALMAAANVRAEYADVNPYALRAATSPDLAARAEGVTIDVNRIANHYQQLAARADSVIVEGIGGWLVPISHQQTMADVVRALELPVILVVNLKLGAINHALLTQAAIAASGCRLAGWVGNVLTGEIPEGYAEALHERLLAPCIGVIPHGLDQASRSHALDVRLLLNAPG